MSTIRPPLALGDTTDRIGWLITLRWIACGCLLSVILIARCGLGMRIQVAPLLVGNVLLLALNILYCRLHRITRPSVSRLATDFRTTRRSDLLVRAQIWTDLTLLAFLLHHAGGFENPFVFFFVFHVAFAGVLLSKRTAYLAATYAVVLSGAIAAAERLGLLAHHHLAILHTQEAYSSTSYYLPSVFLVFAATLYIVVYISADIADRLRARERQLADTNAELVEKDRAKSEYVQTVSHDIRGSIAAIQSCLRVVSDGLTGPVSPQSSEMMGRAERRCRSLLHFVDELFYLSTIRAEPPAQRGTESLVEIARTVADGYSAAARAKGLTLRFESEVNRAQAAVDRGSIEQLLIALLDNAIRYTDAGGTVRVELRLSSDTRKIEIAVCDDGRGIPQLEFASIFEDFFTGSNVQDVEPWGTGLGLPIARYIAGIHGSEITVQSDIGQGSCFGFALPILIEEDGGHCGETTQDSSDRR